MELDMQHDTKDLFVAVDNPEKHSSAIDSYITFRITTKTSRGDFDNPEYIVRRRYNDFLWLRKQLEDRYPVYLVPPLPEKHRARLDRFSLEFLTGRMLALDRFLRRISEHPVLSYHQSYKIFLTAKGPEFQSFKKNGPGMLQMLGESMHNMAAGYMMKERPEEFQAILQYIEKFGEKMVALDNISHRLRNERADHCIDLKEAIPIYTLWSSSENTLSNALNSMANALEKCYSSLCHLGEDYELKQALPIKEYVLYSESAKVALKRRDAFQIEHELTMEELNKKKEERKIAEELDESKSLSVRLIGKDAQLAKEEKLSRLDNSIKILMQQVDLCSDNCTCANADQKADMERWHANKRRDVKDLLVTMANMQISYFQKCLAAWEEALPQINNTDANN